MDEKILLLITDLQIGGTPAVVRELAARLPADVACLAGEGPVSGMIRAAGRRVMALDCTRTEELPKAVTRLLRMIDRGGYTTVFSFLVHANTVAAIASRFCRGVRFIQSIQTTQPTPRWHWWVQGWIAGAAEVIVVPSNSVARAARERSGIAAEKIVVISNAVSLDGGGHGQATGATRSTGVSPVFPLSGEEHGRAAHATNEEGIEGGSLVSPYSCEEHGRDARATAKGPGGSPVSSATRIGFIGRLDPIKRVPDLVEAMTLLPNHQLAIFGEGIDRPHIEQTINSLHLQPRVTLHGAIADPAIALDAIDILVLPSAAEGFGLVLIEAMAAGVPVIGTDVPGIRDVIRHEKNGLLTPAADPMRLARSIRRLSENPVLQNRLIATADRDVRDRFSWEIILPRYQSLLGSGSA